MRQRFRILNRAAGWILALGGETRFCCPVCGYSGPFFVRRFAATRRKHAICPGCGALERHRLQWLVLNATPERSRYSTMRVLHLAPEAFFVDLFRKMFKGYTTADLERRDVDCAVDLTRLPFKDASFDVVYASHVLEHIKDDGQALAEIRRVLMPSGIAFLPVPIFTGIKTIEYPSAVPSEAYHVRQPGYDYYERYRDLFNRVVMYSSNDFDPIYQVHIYEDRTGWPTPKLPYREPMPGEKHEDIVPVCYK